jgi:hypothetical protein
MTITLLDPTGERGAVERPRAPRLAALEGKIAGKTFALLDISKPRGDVFLGELAAQLTTRGATVRRYSKPTFTKPAPPDLRRRIAQECDAVIEALAD